MIRRVSELFRGHTDLILGFNTFLPPGYKIEVVTETPVDPVHARPPIPPPAPQPGAFQPHEPRPPLRAAREVGQPAEFDHAIQYVTKIKKRFVSDLHTYRSFLEILHAYQQRSAAQNQPESIRDVLEKVAALFRDHPDLLMDFAFFLPDSIQAEARERISHIIARQHGDLAAAELAREGDRVYAAGVHAEALNDHEAHADASARGRKLERRFAQYRERMSLGAAPPRSGRARALAEAEREGMLHGQLPPSERTFFLRLKSALGGRETYVEFLKCLDLYAREVIGRQELLALAESLLQPVSPSLFEEFRVVVVSKGGLEVTDADAWVSMPVAEMDLSQCRRCTPSYRMLPPGYPLLACSERAQWEAEVLNDTLVSVPTGSEDYGFNHFRRNQFEDALFRCEDERYEVDMIIDTNMSAIRTLEPLAAEIQALRAASAFEWQMRLDRRSLGVVHLKAIARVYGEHGEAMLELLRKNPAGAIPIILKRLKQKDSEWRLARQRLNKQWKTIMEKNYYRSLDHRSFYFKQADKKCITGKGLLQDMRARIEDAETEVRAVRAKRVARRMREEGADEADEAEADAEAAAAAATEPGTEYVRARCALLCMGGGVLCVGWKGRRGRGAGGISRAVGAERTMRGKVRRDALLEAPRVG